MAIVRALKSRAFHFTCRWRARNDSASFTTRESVRYQGAARRETPSYAQVRGRVAGPRLRQRVKQRVYHDC
jgi:hypothetical protein